MKLRSSWVTSPKAEPTFNVPSEGVKRKSFRTKRQKAASMESNQYQPTNSMRTHVKASPASGLLANTFNGQVYTTQDEKRLAHCLDIAEDISVYKRYRDYGNELQGRPNSRFLDIGCGIGDTCRKMAKRVGSGGKIVGLDTSIGRLKTAERLTTQERRGQNPAVIEWVVGPAGKLPFKSTTFDAIRIERTLQHIGDVPSVVAESSRILAPGGSLVTVDPDWRNFSISSHLTDPQVTKKILDFWMKSFACGDVTERLPAWLKESQFKLLDTKTFWLDYDNSFYLAEILFDLHRLAPSAADAQIISAAEAADWLSSLKEADKRGQLRWAMPLKLFHAET